ncbi:MAG TPA: alkaline phosphatase D family protein [Acidimicrobiales bacterium]|nr:alkaline phosphatase D family protein [Acidimicrobiales bacterium]
MGRRRFLRLGGAGSAALLLGTGSYGIGRARAAPRGVSYPFTLGVASGDPLPGSVVLWTRLAPDPLALDGTAGMPPRPVVVDWEVAEDERFRHGVRRGAAVASPELGHTVHVEARGLRPGREHFYRFRAGGELSPVGRTRTAPHPADRVGELRLAIVACQHLEAGWFTAYRHLLADDPHLVAHCGDYIYESPSTSALNPRAHVGPEPLDLAGYRLRHAQYRTDPDLQAAHVLLPWTVTFDDHEVDNNWAGDVSEDPEVTPEEFRRRRAAAFQAYYEHMPLRTVHRPNGPDMLLHRRLRYGDLANLHVLDGRQHRHPQLACPDPMACPERLDPRRTMLGAEQERWLLDGLRRSGARWDVLVQQVPFTRLDEAAGPASRFGRDNWNWFPAARQRLQDVLATRADLNPMVVGGEAHRHIAADVRADWDDPDSPVVASEIVTTSVTTDGDGEEHSPWVDLVLAENPHVAYARRQRGYVRCRLTRDTWSTDFRVVPFVSRPGAPVATDASFVVEAGRRGLQPG